MNPALEKSRTSATRNESPRILLPACSFVIPCLNEEAGLPACLAAIEEVRAAFEDVEVIVVDNGSDDRSAHLARASSSRVLHCRQRGYGIALRTGIAAAVHDLVVIADADATYDWSEAAQLVRTLLDGEADLVVGNRFAGRLEPGAMPFLNRWLGTPVLSAMITWLHGAQRGVRVGDCNGGMRAFRKRAFQTWQMRADGMEFASEQIVRALRARARYLEVPVTYRKAVAGRRPHLRRWRDGLRHLRLIFRLSRA